MTEEQKIEALQRILQGANVAQVNLGDGYQTFNLGKGGEWQQASTTNAVVADAVVEDEDSSLAESNVIFNPCILTTEEHYRKVRDVIMRFIKKGGITSDMEQINPSAQNEWYYILIAIAETEIAGRNVFTDVNFANQMISWFPWLFHFGTPEEMATFKRKFTKSISAERSLWKYGAKKEVTAIKDMWARQRPLGIDYAKLSRLHPVANGLKKALEELKTEILKAESAR